MPLPNLSQRVLMLPKISDLSVNSDAGAAAIYVHWPFCLKKCPYCDFNSHVRDTVDDARWRDALLAEINWFAERYPNLNARSIFFGGGTPSLMSAETTAAVIERIKHHWAPTNDIEVTLEANPSSVEAGRFKGYRDAGVNRVSLGVQSLRDDSLKFLGRLHDVGEAKEALEIARKTFDRVSFDLIYALPEQGLDAWRTELSEALAMAKGHMSLYQLTIEEGTAFYHQFKRGKFSLPNEEDAAALYSLTQEMTAAAGLPAYEISNHAAAGEQSEHNLTYWRGQPFIGIGPGAHGRLPSKDQDLTAHQQIKRPENWLEAVEQLGCGMESHSAVSAEDRAVETIMMGMRLTDGLDLALTKSLVGFDLRDRLSSSALIDLESSGHIAVSDSHLTLTSKGQPLLNFILGKLLT